MYLPILRKELVKRLNWKVTIEGIDRIRNPFLAFESCLQLSHLYLLAPLNSSTLK